MILPLQHALPLRKPEGRDHDRPGDRGVTCCQTHNQRQADQQLAPGDQKPEQARIGQHDRLQEGSHETEAVFESTIDESAHALGKVTAP